MQGRLNVRLATSPHLGLLAPRPQPCGSGGWRLKYAAECTEARRWAAAGAEGGGASPLPAEPGQARGASDQPKRRMATTRIPACVPGALQALQTTLRQFPCPDLTRRQAARSRRAAIFMSSGCCCCQSLGRRCERREQRGRAGPRLVCTQNCATGSNNRSSRYKRANRSQERAIKCVLKGAQRARHGALIAALHPFLLCSH